MSNFYVYNSITAKGENMGYLVLGSMGFLLLYVFDYNKVKKVHDIFQIFFMIGISMIAYASIMIHLNPITTFSVHFWLAGIFYCMAVLSGLFMFYALFGALPFKQTYVKTSENQTITTGVYALCRHPGVWGFFFLYFFLYLASGNILMLAACVLWTIMDIVHVWIQDQYFFPKTLKGYTDYQQNTPFLLFNRHSLKQCVSSFKRV